MRETHEPVFDVDFVARPEQEPPEAPVVLDLGEDSFDIGVPLTAKALSLLRVQPLPCLCLEIDEPMTDLDPPVVPAVVTLIP